MNISHYIATLLALSVSSFYLFKGNECVDLEKFEEEKVEIASEINSGPAKIAEAELPVVGIEICNNGIDDDGDGLIDSADPDCPAQFICDSRFYQTLEVAGDYWLYEIETDPVELTPLANITGIAGLTDQINGTVFNKYDGYIYFIELNEPYRFYRMGSDFSVVYLGDVTGYTGSFYPNAADMGSDGNVYYRNSIGADIYQLDIGTLTLSQVCDYPSWNAASNNIGDIAFDPTDSKFYGTRDSTNTLMSFDFSSCDTSIIALDTWIEGALGAFFVAADGTGYGYANNTGNLYRIDLGTGQVSVIGTGPTTAQTDGCSCEGLKFTKEVSPGTVNAGGTATFTYTIYNNWYTPLSNVAFRDTLEEGLLWASEPYNLTGGITKGFSNIVGLPIGDFTINNLPVGTVSFQIDVATPAGYSGNNPYLNQAYLEDLPALLGDSKPSDYPITPKIDDPTPLFILTGEICDNGIDDDGDGLIDCADPDCTSLSGASTDVPKTISAIVASTITSDLVFDEGGIIADLDVVDLNITHTWVDDLIISLTSPEGSTAVLMNQPCGQDQDILIDLDDESVSAYPCPPTGGGVYLPDNPLNIFDGESAVGTWTMKVQDVYGAADGGTLNGWGLEVSLACQQVEICSNGVDDDGDGIIDCLDGDCNSPTASITGINDICKGEIITLSAAGGETFLWSTGSTTSTINVNPTSTTNFSVTVSNANGCSDVASTTINVRPIPSSTIEGDTILCPGDSTVLTVSGGTSYLWNNGETSNQIKLIPEETTNYVVTVTNSSGCTLELGHTVTVQNCFEFCGNGIDDDGNGLSDCDDPYCRRISLGNILVSPCIDQPLADIATLDVEISWVNAIPNDTLEVSIYGKTEYIPTDFYGTPYTVRFYVPADGTSNNLISTSWASGNSDCSATASYDSPIACSSETITCDILYLCGEDKPYDGDAWDHGWIAYLDQVNGSSTLTAALTKPDAIGYGLYDPNNTLVPLNVDFSEYDVVIISATTEGYISNDLVNTLKDLPQSILLSNYTLANDFGLSTSEAFYQIQTYAYINHNVREEIYNYDNPNPWGKFLFTHADYLTGGTAFLWTDPGEAFTQEDGILFFFDETDDLNGVSSSHGRRVYLGYHMNGVYGNDENGGSIPAPQEDWFDPVRHLTATGKYYFDLALLETASKCNGVEICNNGIDDDGDGLIDCVDPDCVETPVGSVSANFRTIADGTWTDDNIWQGGVSPNAGNVNNSTISIEHDVVLPSGDIRLGNNSKLWVTNGALTLEGGDFELNGATAILNNSSLTTGAGFGLDLVGSKPKLSVTNGSLDIGKDFNNTKGIRRLENVCLNVAERYVNGERDTLINVCGTIGSSIPAPYFGSSFINQTFSQLYIEDSEFNLEQGDFENSLLGLIDGENLKLWVQNGAATNEGFWTADVTHYCVSSSSNIPVSFLPDNEECGTISWYFDNCDCGCLPYLEQCSSGIDEDGDGLFDCDDPDCGGFVNAGEDVNSCSGESVTLTAVANGDTGPYSFAWSDGLGNTATVSVSPAVTTTYTVTISNSSGCTSSDEVTVFIGVCAEICTDGIDNDGDGLIDCNDPDCRLTLLGTPKSPVCKGGKDGSIDLEVSGGKLPYGFQWSNGANVEDLENLFAGTYQVTVTDDYGCSATSTYLVNDGYGLQLSAEISHSNCYGDATGIIDLSVSNGLQPYSYAWSNGQVTQDISELSAGIYGVTVSDANGCQQTGFYTVYQALASSYDKYYIPLPEAEIHRSMKQFTSYINRSIDNSMRTIISMVATENGTILYYDHWEDGYETDIFNPAQSSTEIWGDGINGNGKPPGYGADALNAGDVVAMDNLVELPRNANQLYYDGRDKIVVSHQIALSRAAWAPNPGPVLSGAVDIMDVNAYGKEFEVPIGEDVVNDDLFEYTSLLVMAIEDNTVVLIDSNGDGTAELTKYLQEGETYQMDGGVESGAKVTSSNPIQAHLITGDYGGRYESRWFTLFPCEKWDNSYYAPVGTTINSDPAHVFVFNPNEYPITVNYATKAGTGSFNVPAKDVYQYLMPMHSGAHFYTVSEEDEFFAISTIDSDAADNDAHDWGYNLVPESYLTVSASIGWGPGNANLSGNGSPAWVISSQPTTLYVDYDGDPSTGTKTDPAGNRYNEDYALTAYESKRVFDNQDNDQTGMYLYTLDGTLISVAWGQDPETAAPGNPFLDFGTTVPPIRKVFGWKDYVHTNDANGDGLVDPGDIITFNLNLQNSGNAPVTGLTLYDDLPAEVTYVPNTTYFNSTLLNDDPTGTAFPIDELGYYLESIPINTTYTFSFQVSVNEQPPSFDEIVNEFTTIVTVPCKTLINDVVIPVVPTGFSSDACTLEFVTNTGDIANNYFEGAEVCVQVSDNDLNESDILVDFFSLTVYNLANNDRETIFLIETGANTGVFEACITSSPAAGETVEDGTLLAQGNQTISASYTDSKYGDTCNDEVGFLLDTDTKPLYFSGTSQSLDRVDPVATIDTTTSTVTLGSYELSTCNVADGFNSFSYSNNDGSENWVSNWEELGETTDPSWGGVGVYSNALRVGGYNNSGGVFSMTGKGIWREADLSDASSATLNLDFFESYYSNSFTATLAVSSNGGASYTDLETFTFSTGQVSRSYDISDYISSNTRIRLLASGYLSEGVTRIMYFDNIEITYSCPGNGVGGSGGSGESLGVDMAIWSGESSSEWRNWNGSSFGSEGDGSSQGDRWRIMQGASSPTRDEKIVIGIENGGEISGELWNGSYWDNADLTNLADVDDTYWWSCDVAYESLSGDAMLIWSGGNTYSNEVMYQIWDGTSWSSPTSISAYSGGEPKQMQLAADPNSDDMVLIVNDISENDYALVWNGSSWGNSIFLDNNSDQDRTDINVVYEGQSGEAMVVYEALNSSPSIRSRIWNGNYWEDDKLVYSPVGADGYARWSFLASDPSSDRIILGVITSGSDAYAAVWNGSTWGTSILTITSNEVSKTTSPCMDVAFESNSGQAMVLTADIHDDAYYQIWDPISGWGTSNLYPVSANSDFNSILLEPDPTSDFIMAMLQDGGKDLNVMPWNGSSWQTNTEVDPDTREDKNQPFVFLWSDFQPGGSGGTADTVNFVQGIPMCTDLNMPEGGIVQVTAHVLGGTTGGSTTTITSRINQSSDDAEETGPDGSSPGSMYLNSSDIEMTEDPNSSQGTQKVGFRFNSLNIPQGATITNAYFTFHADTPDSGNSNSGATSLTIHGQAADNPSTFTSTNSNVSSRPTTSASANWSPNAWSAGTDYYSSDLSAVVQEIVDRPGWSSGNSMAFIISGTGSRVADSWNGNSTTAPLLTIEYSSGGGSIPANPDVTAILKHNTSTFATLDNPVYDETAGTLTWSQILSSDYTLPEGEKVGLDITLNEPGYSFDILYDSETYPSRIDLPTQTIINVEELAVYDSAYTAGTVIQGAKNGETVFIRTTVSDPFGPEDITSLDLVITSPSGIVMVDTTLMDEGVAGTEGCNKIYEFVWVTGVEQGIYQIDIVAHEGYEGIKDEASTTIEIQYDDFGTPCQVQFTNGTSAVSNYDPNDLICLEVIDIDENQNSAMVETVQVKLTSSVGDEEVLTLVETGANTGTFKTCINSNSATIGSHNDGTIYAPMGSQLLMKYSDPDFPLDECTNTALINSVDPEVDITINLIIPADEVAVVGENIRFDITVSNPGPTVLYDLIVTNDFLASELNFVNASLTPNTVGTGSLAWNIDTPIQPGQTFTIKTYFTGAAPANTAVSTAAVSGEDENATPVSAGPVNDDVLITDPKISVLKTLTDPSSGPYLVGDTLTFDIQLTNTGNTNIQTLPLYDSYSSFCLEFIDASPASTSSGGGGVIWDDLGTLNVGASTTVTTRFKIIGNCSPVENYAEVTQAIDENGDEVPEAFDTESLPVDAPPVAIDDFDSTGVSTPVTTFVLNNDYDPNDNLDIGSINSVGVLMPTNGFISINTSTGEITYAPNPGFVGTDTYEYIICDSTNLCDTALVTIVIINEDCTNGIDDDGDGLVDCDDPDCTNFNNGGIIGGNETDCGEYDPFQIISYSQPSGGTGGDYFYKWEISTNGGSNWDVIPGATAAHYDPPIITQTTWYRRLSRRFSCAIWKVSNIVTKSVEDCPEICDNGLDDDGDGLIDCDDPDCGPTAFASPDANICMGDSTEISGTASGGEAPYQFIWDNSLGVGESHVVSPTDTTTYRLLVLSSTGCFAVDSVVVNVVLCPEDCTDGIDNDGDGLIDCDDPDCVAVGQPQLADDYFNACPGSPYQDQVIFNDANLQDPSYSIFSVPDYGSAVINSNGVFTYIPASLNCGSDRFVYQVCNLATGCCDTASVYLTIGDNAPPILQNIPPDVTIACNESVPEIPELVFAADGCPGIYVSYDETSNQPEMGACQNYQIVRKWTAYDLCGNQSIATQTITVEDNEAPEIFRVYTLSNDKKLLGGVTNLVTEQWKFIEFPINFSKVPVVIPQVISENDEVTVNVRLRNINKTGFEMRLQEEEAEDGTHAPEMVAWMAIEPGAVPGVENLQAGVLKNVTNAVSNLTYDNEFSGQPAIVTSVQTFADDDPIGIRLSNPSSTGINLYLEEEESNDSEVAHGNESVGYVAVEPGTFTDMDGVFIGESNSLSINANWQTVPLVREYTKPVVVFGGIASGGDAAVVRVRNVTSTSFEVKIEEWEVYNGQSPNRTVGYLVMEGSIPAVPEYYCDFSAVELTPGVNLFATDNCDEQVAFDYQETSDFTMYGLRVARIWTALDDCGNSIQMERTDTCNLASVQLKAFIHGAMIDANSQTTMSDKLRQKSLVPLTEPYSELSGYVHSGFGGGETTTQDMMDVTGDDAIVDWVFVEIRNKNNTQDVLATCSALLQKDGDVVDANGLPVLLFPTLGEDNYFVSLRHRNHLGMMMDSVHYLNTEAVPVIDFTSLESEMLGNYTAGRFLNAFSRACWSGDVNGDGRVIYQGPANDVFTLFSRVLTFDGNVNYLANYIGNGYYREDVNLDGRVIYQGPGNDRALILYNTVLSHPNNTAFLANFVANQMLP